MKITKIHVGEWRHFRNITIEQTSDASIVCLVGANGAGKSQLLELIAACAHRVGFTPGFSQMRGDPFGEKSEFSVTFEFPAGLLPFLDAFLSANEYHAEQLKTWDRTVTVSKSNNMAIELTSGSLTPGVTNYSASGVSAALQASSDLHYLTLDADRSYPKWQIQSHELHTIFDRDWSSTGKQSSFQLTRTLYEEWFKYLISVEAAQNNRFVSEIRLAREGGAPDPVYVDQFLDYRDAIKEVLPHLIFTGVDSQKREIKFNSTGVELGFHQLSGGEREIAFLIGQIDRFKLTRGLLLIDEPELHLNPELLRNWVSYLKRTITAGQIWLATHSLDVVESAGGENTFLLERETTSRQVNSVLSLPIEPLVDALARTVGSPAFSIAAFSFIYVEGEESLRERDRFRRICGSAESVRFIEAGNGASVLRNVQSLRNIGKESGRKVRVGGVVDRDFRDVAAIKDYKAEQVHVTDVHEIENYYLHPETLSALIVGLGGDPDAIPTELALISDQRAGLWIFESSRVDGRFRSFPPPSPRSREIAANGAWSSIGEDLEKFCYSLSNEHGGLDDLQKSDFYRFLYAKAKSYERVRQEDSLWMRCEGKEIFRSMVRFLGFADELTAEKAIAKLWKDRQDLIPKGLCELRAYINGL